MSPYKIVNLSLHRSATLSFSEFMYSHGFRSAHWPGNDIDEMCRSAVPSLDTGMVFAAARRIIQTNDAFSDVPYCFLYKEFLHAYPDARFFITVRRIPSWIASVRRHIGQRELYNLEKMQYWLNAEPHKSFIYDYGDDELQTIYMKHLVTVVNAMQSARARFRVFELDERSTNQEMAAALANFAGFQIKLAFPKIREWTPNLRRSGQEETEP